MVNFAVLVPEATVNYVTNPALRYDTTDWNAQGATLTRVLTRARFGIASLRVVTNGSALYEGAYFRVSALSGVSEPITVSAYVRGTGRVRIRLDNNVVGGTEFASQPVELTDARWQRIWVTGFTTGGNDLRLFVETAEGSAAARTFYVDGAQLERKSAPTTYCDGDQPGCRWNGMFHASSSQRAGNTRAGGSWLQLAGAEREEEDLYMTVAGGLGMAPLTNNVQSFALEAGAYFQNTKIQPRVITLTFHAKHKVDDEEQAVSLEHLHELRESLIAALKPDRTGAEEEIWFAYEDGGAQMWFQARYDGGLEGEWDIRNQFYNSFAVRLLAVSPLMHMDTQEAADLDFQETFTANFVLGRVNGRWGHLNYGMDDDVFKIARGPRGEIYAIGTFDKVNNNAAAVDPLRASQVAYWNGERWVSIGITGSSASSIYDIAVAKNGNVVITGNLTSINGVSTSYIAQYNGTTWSALGTGLNSQGLCVAASNNGDIYCGGSFTTAGGVTCYRMARWDGTQWNRVGQYGGLNGQVNDLWVSDTDRKIYCGGVFTNEEGVGGSTLNRVAQYNMDTGLFSAMGTGMSGTVNAIVRAGSGLVYAGGNFLTADGQTVNHIAQWNGTGWTGLGAGFNYNGTPALASISSIWVRTNEHVVVGGTYNRMGTQTMEHIAEWNGSVWTLLDVRIPADPNLSVAGLLETPEGDLYIGISANAGTAVTAPGFTTVTNPGDRATAPVFYVKGSGTLNSIENQTNGRRMMFDLQVSTGEEVVIDLRNGTLVSSTRGNILGDLLEGSDFRAFRLEPGENVLAVLMTRDVGAQITLQFTPQYWGVDALGQ